MARTAPTRLASEAYTAPSAAAGSAAAAPPERSLSVLRLMTWATISLSAVCFSSAVIQSQLLHKGGLRGRFDSRGAYEVAGSYSEEPDDGAALLADPGPDRSAPADSSASSPLPSDASDSDASAPSPPPSDGFGQQSQVEFLRNVKRRLKIETPIDETFWRPYARASAEGGGGSAPGVAPTNLIFVAGAEGTGHHFLTAVMMRLSELMPMTLVQEQMFQALWWQPKDRTPATFWAAVEAFHEWVQAARSLGKHPAFCARTCLRLSGMKHCSWISGMQEQREGRLLDGKNRNISYQPIGQMFSYPFSRSGNETEDGTHYPRLADLQYLCELAGVRLKVVALWREPVDAIMSMNNRGLPKIWRRAGRTFKLHKQVELFLSQLDEMHSQLAALPPDSFRVVNYTHMLGNAKEYVRDLAAFLEVPEAHLDRAFTLSAKAKPKKRPRAPSSLPEGTWSDAVRQDFIQQRLAEAAASAKPPRCCDAWTRRLATQRLAQMPSPASSAKTRPRPPHWFTTWAQTAPPPLRAQAISFTHVVNPFDPGNSSEHRQAQRVTLASISHASALAAAQGIAVEVVCAVFPEDEAHVRREPLQCLLERINVSAATALPQFRHPVRLPFLNMLLYAGYSRGSGKYLIYTNIDIGLQPPFYLKLARQMQVMPGVPISSIREEFEHVEPAFGVEHAIARRGTGLQHPGHDCWAFPREWVPRLILGFTLVGVSMVATSLMQALHALSGCRMSLLSPKLTFHFVDGDSVVKHPSNQRARNDKIFTGLYTAWNCAQFARDRRDVLEVYPEYNQCWFSQQAEWNLYSYQCGTTIEHLPHEFKLLWQSAHNRTIRPAHGDCNLPSTCAKCRGRDGAARPGADMMAPAPCAFCRCRGDLPTPPYITPPKQVARPATAGAAAGHRAAGNHSVRKGAPALSAVVR